MRAAECLHLRELRLVSLGSLSDRGVVVGVDFFDFRGRRLRLLEQPDLHLRCAFSPTKGICAFCPDYLNPHGDAVR